MIGSIDDEHGLPQDQFGPMSSSAALDMESSVGSMAEGRMGGQSNEAKLMETLDEPVSDTIMRDVRAIGHKLVLFSFSRFCLLCVRNILCVCVCVF